MAKKKSPDTLFGPYAQFIHYLIGYAFPENNFRMFLRTMPGSFF